MSPIVKDPQDVRARYADRLARQHHAVREAWRATRSPELAAVMADLTQQREDHQNRTGWVADHDGETTTYYYTDPNTRDGVTP